MGNYSYNQNKEGLVSSNNADFGISLQFMLCERAELYVSKTAQKHFQANHNEEYEEELIPICKKIESIIPSKIERYLTYSSDYTTSKQTTSPHNFLLHNGKTLSIRTTKTCDKVAPRTLGQAGSDVLTDFFSDVYGGEIRTQEDAKRLIFYHIHEIFPDSADYLFK